MLIFNNGSSYFEKTKNYNLLIDNNKQIINIVRIKDVSNIYLNFVYSKELMFDEGFFIYRPKTFGTFFFKMDLDLIFVDNNGLVLKVYSNFKKNKLTKNFKNAKFVYILPKNFVKDNRIEIIENKTRIVHSKNKKKFKYSYERLY